MLTFKAILLLTTAAATVVNVQGGELCVDLPVWAQSCRYYTEQKWCSIDGSPGENWDSTWGTFAEQTHIQSVHVTEGCCGCGGGTTPTPPPAETYKVKTANSEYMVMAKNTNVCTTGTEPIVDWGECREVAYADSSGGLKNFNGNWVNMTDHPSGCVKAKTVSAPFFDYYLFNVNSGGTQPNLSPVCKIPAPPTPEPTPGPTTSPTPPATPGPIAPPATPGPVAPATPGPVAPATDQECASKLFKAYSDDTFQVGTKSKAKALIATIKKAYKAIKADYHAAKKNLKRLKLAL